MEAEKAATAAGLTKGDLPAFLREPGLDGVLSEDAVSHGIEELRALNVDEYIRRSVWPSENPKRKSAPEVLRQLGAEIVREVQEGPLYLAELVFSTPGRSRRIVALAQNRKAKNGVWMPNHHDRAAELMREYSSYGMPVVTFIDTPGADAGEEANLKNQAHSISHLIMEMANLQLPSVGVVFGNGYSGGAIPLATTNILLTVRDGAFNTIHPQGLSEIAYNYNLSWQECAKYIGVSAYELYRMGHVDGIIDYSPMDSGSPKPLLDAIFSALDQVERNAVEFLGQPDNQYFFTHYQESIQRYLNPTELLIGENQIADKSPTGMLNVFGSVYRFHRYLKLRTRLQSQSILRYSRLDTFDIPEGELQGRMEREREERFRRWVERPLEIRYDETLTKRYKRLLDTERSLGQDRYRITSFFLGTPEKNFQEAGEELIMDVGLYLYNFWKVDTRENLVKLLDFLDKQPATGEVPPESATLLDVLGHEMVRREFPGEVKNLVLFDLIYDKLIENLPLIATMLKDTNEITLQSMEDLLDKVIMEARGSFESFFTEGFEGIADFFGWLERLISRRDAEQLMRQVSEWKRLAHPRLSEPLFGILSYYFSNLLPSYYAARRGEKAFDGKINPRHIGIKDFWNRLNHAYSDLLIQNLLAERKRTTPIAPQQVVDHVFTNFESLNDDLMSADPVHFPGYRQSIERALEQNIPPVGVLTGLADFEYDGVASRVGVVVSNTLFQAGAFDMASGEKVCKLLVECAVNKLPVVMFIASGGMQTKEGAGALYSMAVINDRITRFVKDFDLPIICFGFRDCTGGGQASFVTHRLVKTFYLSGCVMPFAGQRVVPSHLPAQAILANYLSQVEGSMDGLVVNPFDEHIDEQFLEIDPDIPVPQETIHEAIARVLRGEYKSEGIRPAEEVLPKGFITFDPVKRLLIHARGATAARLVEGAHAAEVEVVLVQSDADMESYPTKLLNAKDRLVCLGGNTPQESYLNGMSVVRIAEQEGADAVHPGIGFLSENPNFAWLVRKNGFNFVGPRAFTMELMGNKSNAIATARRLKVGVVPGSQGVLTEPNYAASVAEEIGYPVLIKAAFGGGGKGMRVVFDPDNFKDSFKRTSQEAASAFGNGDVYLEKFVESMRHVEVQILRDSKGNTQILGLRDCTVQRNNQKLIEESGSYRLSKARTEEIFESARVIANDIDYIGAGTIEFIYDRVNDAIYFMEMNTRLQVEHPVTEMITGTDIVADQIRIASGQNIGKKSPRSKGYAMEVRVNAEKMVVDGEGKVNFLPSPGTVNTLVLPKKPNIRIVRAVDEGDTIPPYYDSLILQIIAHGRTRAEVIRMLQDYLDKVKLEGVYTNLALMEAVLKDSVFQKGDYDTGYIEDFFARANLKSILRRMENRNRVLHGVIDIESIRIENSDELRVLAPRTGVFYGSPTPDDPPFVQLGEEFDVNKTMCLLEAMKVFEGITLEEFNAGNGEDLFPEDSKFVITRIFAESGQTVNEGDLLFIVKPVGPSEQASHKKAAS
ncbi:MAG: ATP-grasp domain-containing protein [SAR324 cluster bacterium]|nr:ATP-grasp domain-containing protein [SAR324 cluster bacterium]